MTAAIPAGRFYYLHDLAGRPITELSSTGGFTRGEIYVNGQHLATYADSTTYFDYSNWLGTTRMIATLDGLEQSACTSWPFGAGLNCTASPTPIQFTGQVHDASTGLDHFPARYYTSAWGLFTTPNPGGAGASVGDPESWDAYAYVKGSPETLTDPGGMTYCAAGARIEPLKDCISDAAFAKLSKKEQSGYVQVSKDRTLTVTAQMPGPVPLIGITEASGDPFLALATAVTRTNPGGFIRNFEIQAFITGATGPLLGMLGDAADLAAGADILSDPAEVAAKASSAVGNQTITVPSREVAEQAADEFLGLDKQPLYQRFGSRAGQQIGWESTDGKLQVRDDGDHFNFRDTNTGANLHVYFGAQP